MEALRCHLRDAWREAHPQDLETAFLRIIDSAPIPICTYSRSSRCQSISLEQSDEYFGVCTSKKTRFFGPRCHGTVYLDQMIDSWCLAPGYYHDLRPVPDRIETALSVLTTSFSLDKLGSRTFPGMVARVLAYISSFFLAKILTPDVIAYQPC